MTDDECDQDEGEEEKRIFVERELSDANEAFRFRLPHPPYEDILVDEIDMRQTSIEGSILPSLSILRP